MHLPSIHWKKIIFILNMGSDTGQVMTLANSIIGVSVLAMPYCFKQCGIVLSTLLLCLSSILSRFSCHFLLKAAIITRRRNYEYLAFHVFGSKGKLGVELAIIGFLLGTCVAFFVVMGDLGPAIISSMLGLHRTDTLRTSVLLCMALFVVLPLGLLRNVDSLSSLCTASIAFYLCLVLKVMGEATAPMVTGDWLKEVNFWRPEGLLQCLPIFSMALFCQTQLFEIFDTVPNAALDKLNAVVRAAVNMCTAVYIFVGFFGYIAFCKQNITGNILISLSETMSSEVIKLGFVLSVAVSFPLVIFPCRASLYSLLYRSAQPPVHDIATSHVPEGRFKMLTFSIVGISLLVGLLLPNIERVLGIIGSTIGVTICIIVPSLLLGNTARHPKDKFVSQIILWSGAVIMILGTYAHILNSGEGVGADPGLEHAANRILDHAVDQLNERPPDVIAFQPIPSEEKVKTLLELSADRPAAAQPSKGLPDRKEEMVFGSDKDKSLSFKDDKVDSPPMKLPSNQYKEPIPGSHKVVKQDEKVQEPVAPADTGEKQQEPPIPMEVVVKHASAEPIVPPQRKNIEENNKIVPRPKIEVKEQQAVPKNLSAVAVHAEQVNQDAIHREDVELALEAKGEKEKMAVIDKIDEKQIAVEEEKKKAEEQKLIETLKEHQEVQRDMLNEQQRILRELKKHEKIQQAGINEVVKEPRAVQDSAFKIANNNRNSQNENEEKNVQSQYLKNGSSNRKVVLSPKSNISAIAKEQPQPPFVSGQIEAEGSLFQSNRSKNGKVAPVVPLPLAYSAKMSSPPVEKILHQPESKPGARDILGSDVHPLDRGKRDVINAYVVDNEQGAGNGPLVEEESLKQELIENILEDAPKEECKRDSKPVENGELLNVVSSEIPLSNIATNSQALKDPKEVSTINSEKVVVERETQSKDSSSDLIEKNNVDSDTSKAMKGERSPVIELKTPSSISEPRLEIQSSLNSEVKKFPDGSMPLPTENNLKSVQSKEGQ